MAVSHWYADFEHHQSHITQRLQAFESRLILTHPTNIILQARLCELDRIRSLLLRLPQGPQLILLPFLFINILNNMTIWFAKRSETLIWEEELLFVAVALVLVFREWRKCVCHRWIGRPLEYDHLDLRTCRFVLLPVCFLAGCVAIKDVLTAAAEFGVCRHRIAMGTSRG